MIAIESPRFLRWAGVAPRSLQCQVPTTIAIFHPFLSLTLMRLVFVVLTACHRECSGVFMVAECSRTARMKGSNAPMTLTKPLVTRGVTLHLQGLPRFNDSPNIIKIWGFRFRVSHRREPLLSSATAVFHILVIAGGLRFLIWTACSCPCLPAACPWPSAECGLCQRRG